MTRLVWQAGMAVGLSEFCEPAGIPTFGYEATTAGIAGTHEPTWPLTAGATVTDGTIVWTARAATTITWTARALYKTDLIEPTWPLTVGATVTDNGITWTTITPAITDSKCPQSKIAFAIQHKVYSPDADVTRYCSTDNPRDWSTQDDAGFFPSGLNSPSSPYVTAMGEYRGRLAVWTAGGLQIWTPDPDPANIALFDTIDGIGTSYSRSHASIAGDLYFLSHAGVRSLSIAAGANTLQSGDVGAPIDSIVKAMAAAGDDAIGTYYPGFGQYWLTFTPQRPQFIANSTPTFPDTCNDSSYSHSVTLTGGSGTYVSAVFTGGTYPSGATLTIVGNQLTLAFTHATAATYTFYVAVTDSIGVTSMALTCVVVVHNFQISGTLPNGLTGAAYSASLTLLDGVAPYGTPTIVSGALPTGGSMSVVGNTLVFSWPNTVVSGTYTFTARITDATGCIATSASQVVVMAAALAGAKYYFPMSTVVASGTSAEVIASQNGIYSSGLSSNSAIRSGGSASMHLSAVAQGMVADNLNTFNIDATNGWTIAVWCQPTNATAGSVIKNVAGYWQSEQFGYCNWSIRLRGTGNMTPQFVYFDGSSGGQTLSASSALAVGDIAALAITYLPTGSGKGTLKLYVNGSVVSTLTNVTGPGVPIGRYLVCGSHFYPSSYGFIGNISDLVMWERTLSAAEITTSLTNLASLI